MIYRERRKRQKTFHQIRRREAMMTKRTRLPLPLSWSHLKAPLDHQQDEKAAMEPNADWRRVAARRRAVM